MPLPGGMSISISTLAFIGWHWIIYLSQVCPKVFHNGLLVTFSATSVNIKCTFSQGWILLSHICNQLSVQSMRTLLCLGAWSLMGYVKDCNLKAAAVLPEASCEEEDLAYNWDAI